MPVPRSRATIWSFSSVPDDTHASSRGADCPSSLVSDSELLISGLPCVARQAVDELHERAEVDQPDATLGVFLLQEL